ncbi:hypothetical protein [Chryseobacterium sp. R2A-55]|uniref:hypothetical protein n=1 Tax=Chryseobacterium sp. R2A-55 TaxID=2744445 RepID=UPI001F355C71|nr:hypothetical protein [Chryseobacterium sp. R2A-55]
MDIIRNMKVRLFLTVAFMVFFHQNFFSQETVIYDQYPYGQEAYPGGKKQLYKDIHQAIIDNKIEKCANPIQKYRVKLIVQKDASVLFVKNPDSAYIESNKCAYDLSKNILKYLAKWKPAEYNREKLNAIYEFDIVPADLFDEFVDGYVGVGIDRNIPQFPGGLEEFRNKFMKFIEIPESQGRMSCEVFFKINKEGQIVDLITKSSPYNAKLEQNIKNAIAKIKDRWILPKDYDSRTELFRYQLPLNFEFH